MTAYEWLIDNGYDGVAIFDNYDYDSAFIGVSEDYRAVYDFELMVDYLVQKEGFSDTDAIEWIEYNTIRSLPYWGDQAPIILHRRRD